MGLIKVWQVRGMGEDFFGYFFMEKKRRERGNREKKERKSKKNGAIRCNYATYQPALFCECLIFGLITQYYGKRINFINRIY